MKRIILLLFILLTQVCFAQWEQCNNGFTTDYQSIISSHNGKIITGSLDGGIYFSTNNGDSWQPKNFGMFNYKFGQMASNGKRTYFAASDQWNGLLYNTEEDVYFHRYYYARYYPLFISLATEDTNIIAGAYNCVLISNENRKPMNLCDKINGLPELPFCAVAVYKDNFYAGAWGGGIYYSNDYGNSWIERNNGLKNKYILSLAVIGDSIIAGTLGGGIFRSTDKGENWAQSNSGFTNLTILTLAIEGNNIFAGTGGGGVFISTDFGKTWKERNNGLPELFINSIAVNEGRMYAGINGAGVFCSLDSGKSWVEKNNGIENKFVGSVAICGKKVIAAVLGDFYYFSTDGGESWVKRYFWIDGPCGNSIKSIFQDDYNIFVGTEGRGIYLSSNGGESWMIKNTGLKNLDINTINKNENNYYVGTEGKGLYISSDNGDNWIQLDTATFDSGISSLAFKGNNYFVGTNNKGLYISTDQGKTWNLRNKEIEKKNVTSICLSYNNIIIGTNPYYMAGSLYVSSDNGESWVMKFDSTMVFNIIKYQNYCLAAMFSGIFISSNDGLEWFKVSYKNSGSSGIAINGEYIFSVAASGAIVESCMGGGVKRAKLSDLFSDVNEDSETVSGIKITPNPASDFIEIHNSTIDILQPSEIIFYNSIGEIVLNVGIQNLDHKQIDISNLPAGLYFLRYGTQTGMFIKE